MTGWTVDPQGAVLAIRVTPRASKDMIAAGDDRIAVRLRAPPVDGAANEALIAFLAKHFDLPRSAVSILSGETARLKRVRLAGDPQRLASLLAAL